MTKIFSSFLRIVFVLVSLNMSSVVYAAEDGDDTVKENLGKQLTYDDYKDKRSCYLVPLDSDGEDSHVANQILKRILYGFEKSWDCNINSLSNDAILNAAYPFIIGDMGEFYLKDNVYSDLSGRYDPSGIYIIFKTLMKVFSTIILFLVGLYVVALVVYSFSEAGIKGTFLSKEFNFNKNIFQISLAIILLMPLFNGYMTITFIFSLIVYFSILFGNFVFGMAIFLFMEFSNNFYENNTVSPQNINRLEDNENLKEVSINGDKKIVKEGAKIIEGTKMGANEMLKIRDNIAHSVVMTLMKLTNLSRANNEFALKVKNCIKEEGKTNDLKGVFIFKRGEYEKMLFEDVEPISFADAVKLHNYDIVVVPTFSFEFEKCVFKNRNEINNFEELRKTINPLAIEVIKIKKTKKSPSFIEVLKVFESNSEGKTELNEDEKKYQERLLLNIGYLIYPYLKEVELFIEDLGRVRNKSAEIRFGNKLSDTKFYKELNKNYELFFGDLVVSGSAASGVIAIIRSENSKIALDVINEEMKKYKIKPNYINRDVFDNGWVAISALPSIMTEVLVKKIVDYKDIVDKASERIHKNIEDGIKYDSDMVKDEISIYNKIVLTSDGEYGEDSYSKLDIDSAKKIQGILESSIKINGDYDFGGSTSSQSYINNVDEKFYVESKLINNYLSPMNRILDNDGKGFGIGVFGGALVLLKRYNSVLKESVEGNNINNEANAKIYLASYESNSFIKFVFYVYILLSLAPSIIFALLFMLIFLAQVLSWFLSLIVGTFYSIIWAALLLLPVSERKVHGTMFSDHLKIGVKYMLAIFIKPTVLILSAFISIFIFFMGFYFFMFAIDFAKHEISSEGTSLTVLTSILSSILFIFISYASMIVMKDLPREFSEWLKLSDANSEMDEMFVNAIKKHSRNLVKGLGF